MSWWVCDSSAHGAISATKDVDGKKGIAVLPQILIHEELSKTVTNHLSDMSTLTCDSTNINIRTPTVVPIDLIELIVPR